VYRPAAIAQLQSVTAQVGADFFPSTAQDKPVDIALNALDWAKKHYHDVLIIDTAGRLGIDEEMMQEIAAVHGAVKPIETLFVVDAMLGQDAINTAKAFNDALPLTGIVLTKLDGDSRGGAALSVRHITGKPIKFAGVSEKLDGLEAFDPPAWPTACWAWATSWRWWKKRARAWTPRRPPSWPPRSSRAPSST
jgi:signal recognition particle subunit SRP54